MRPRPTRAALALAIGAALLVAASSTAPVCAQTGELPEELRTIADVRFRGMRALKPHQLKAAGLRTRRPSFLPWRDKPTLRRDYLRADSAAILSFYGHYGYLDANVRVRLEPTKDARAARVVFEIREGALTRVGRVELSGNDAIRANDLRHVLLAQPGRPFDPAFLQIDAQKVGFLYQERGYFVGVSDSMSRGVPDSAHADVRYDVFEGPQYRVGAIGFETRGRVRESLGRRELLLRPGDIYARSRLDRSIERLYQTGLYRAVQVTPVRDSSARTVALQILVSERKSRWIDGGVGSGTSDRFRVAGEWGHRNLDTRALRGVLNGEYALDGQANFRKLGTGATLTEPWLLGIRLLGQAGVFYRRQDDRANPSYVQKTDVRGFNFSLFRELGRLTRLTLVEQNSLVHQGYDTTRTNSPVPDTTLARLQSQVIPRYRTNSLRATLERDSRNDRVNPSHGSYQTLVEELAGGPLLKGQTSYHKSIASSNWYFPLENGWLLAARASAGMMAPFGATPENFAPDPGADEQVSRVPRESRFFIGGVNSLRGYGENSVTTTGGLAMGLANIELRIPLVGPFGVEAFVDAGNVWDRPEYIRASDLVPPWRATRVKPGDLRYSYGVGARLVLPFGPLRVDLAWSHRPDFPHGTIGRRQVPFAYQFAIGPSF